MANRYWRVNITANASNNNPMLETITMATAAGGTNLITQQASCSAQTSYSASYGPGLVVVGVAGQWSANGGPSQWWQYDLGAGNSASVNNFTFTTSAGRAGQAPTAFTIQSSSDGVTFFDEWSGTFSAWVDTDTKSTTNPAPVTAPASAPGNAMVSQSRLEVLGKGFPKVTVAQSQLEVLGKTSPAALVSQSFLEVLFRPSSNTPGPRPRRVFVAMT